MERESALRFSVTCYHIYHPLDLLGGMMVMIGKMVKKDKRKTRSDKPKKLGVCFFRSTEKNQTNTIQPNDW